MADFLLGTEEESVFLRTYSVGGGFVQVFLLTWLSIKMLWSRMFRTFLRKEEVGSLALIDILMIGSYGRWRTYCTLFNL